MSSPRELATPPPPPSPASAPVTAPTWQAGRLWRVIRWVPLALLATTLVGGLAAIVFIDGFGKVVAWYLAQVAVVIAAALVAVAALVGLVLGRRRGVGSRLAWPTLICAVATLAGSIPWALGLFPIAFPVDRSDVAPSVAIRVPVDGPTIVAWGGDSMATNYHAAFPDQRWAYDLLIEPALVDSPELADYGCFGVPVHAPAAGEVVWVIDGLVDQVPGESDTANPTGNTVAIQIATTQTYLVIAHLQNGSVSVAEGDVVDEGDVVGRCGNSGNTSEPHVHIHHQRQRPDASSLGFAEGLPLSFRDNSGPSFPLGGLEKRDGRVVATGDEIEHQQIAPS